MKPNHRLEAGLFIVECEARTDKNGHIRVYKLPAADGGGTYEVAGINDRYHPQKAAELRQMIELEYPDVSVRNSAAEYIAGYTDIVAKWVKHPAIEFFLRDSCFNRGPKGALRILQRAVGVADDGKFGPITKAAVAKAETYPATLLAALRKAREAYERRIAPPVGARAQFWKGLVNRWNKTTQAAQRYL